MASEVVPADVLSIFCKASAHCTVKTLGNGNINDTYLLESPSFSFVLQRINSSVFPEPLRIIQNFHKITTHLHNGQKESKHQLLIAMPVCTLEGDLFYRDHTGEFWRGQTYLPHNSCEALTSTWQAGQVGEALAAFHLAVSDLGLRSLEDPLPGFHNLPLYLEDFDRELCSLMTVTSKEVRYCLESIDRYRERMTTLENARRAGILTLQPVHGDPKIENFLFSGQGEVLGVLDLDTVASGLVHLDLGDCLRSCCNRAGEKGQSGGTISFDMGICAALLDGYFSGPDTTLGEEQRSYIFDGILHISFELGLRFITDHLRGNRYFKVVNEDDNLKRAVNLFRLTDDILQNEREIRSLVLKAGLLQR